MNNERKNKTKEKLRVLYKKVGQNPEVKIINNTLEAKQALVGGLIDIVEYKDGLIVCNDEGKLLNMIPNVVFDLDYIAGDFFVVGDDYENGDFKSLSEKEIKEYTEDLKRRSFNYMPLEKKLIREKSSNGKYRENEGIEYEY